MTSYVFGKVVSMPFDSAVQRITEELAKVGFGVLTEIDVQATMKKKIGQEMPPYRILGACNPHFASRAIAAVPQIGALLPCNVVVRTEDGRTVIEALDPKMIAEVPGNPALAPIAEEAGQRIQAVLDALAHV